MVASAAMESTVRRRQPHEVVNALIVAANAAGGKERDRRRRRQVVAAASGRTEALAGGRWPPRSHRLANGSGGIVRALGGREPFHLVCCGSALRRHRRARRRDLRLVRIRQPRTRARCQSVGLPQHHPAIRLVELRVIIS